MTTKLAEVANVKWTLCVLGDNDELVSGRTFRLCPTDLEIAEHLVRFNYPRREEHRKTRVVLIRTEARVERISVPSVEEMRQAVKIVERHRGLAESANQLSG